MLLMGDEVRRTQRGNNNAYCQDDKTSWFDWTLTKTHADVHRFVALLTRRRLLRDIEPEFRRESLNQVLREATKAWHGVALNQPDWTYQSHSLALSARAPSDELSFYLILNAYWEALDFELPLAPGAAVAGWQRWIDTSLDWPEDIMDAAAAPAVAGMQYRVAPRSVAALLVRTDVSSGPVIELKPKSA